jgi:hypothetical protein
MVLPADPLPLTPEEQGRLLARVYAFILSDKFTGTHKDQEFQRATPPAITCQPQLAGIIQVVDAQALLPQEVGE